MKIVEEGKTLYSDVEREAECGVDGCGPGDCCESSPNIDVEVGLLWEILGGATVFVCLMFAVVVAVCLGALLVAETVVLWREAFG